MGFGVDLVGVAEFEVDNNSWSWNHILLKGSDSDIVVVLCKLRFGEYKLKREVEMSEVVEVWMLLVVDKK